MWFEVDRARNTLTVKKTLATKFYDFGFRFSNAFLVCAIFAILFYGIDYLGRLSAGVEVAGDFWFSVLILVVFFSIAWANLALFRSGYFAIDKHAQEIQILQKWIFAYHANAEEIAFEHVVAIELTQSWLPSIRVVFKDGNYTLLRHFSGTALMNIFQEIETFNLPFELRRL